MKQVLFLLSMNICMNIYGTVRTVSNNPANLAQFNTIQAAVNASSSGDTVLVHGSPTRYAGFTITDKRLTIMGPGWAPLKSFSPFKATVDDITITGSWFTIFPPPSLLLYVASQGLFTPQANVILLLNTLNVLKVEAFR